MKWSQFKIYVLHAILRYKNENGFVINEGNEENVVMKGLYFIKKDYLSKLESYTISQKIYRE